MRFPNAYAGVKTLFVGFIFALLSSVCSTVMLMFLYLSAKVELKDGTLVAVEASGFTALLVIIIGAAVSFISLISLILEMIGSAKAAKDEETFKVVIYMISVGLAVSAISGIFSGNSKLVGITNLISDFIELFIGIYILQGIINLAGKCDNAEMEANGAKLYKTIIGLYSLVILFQLFTMVFNGTGVLVAAGIFTVLSGVLSLVQFVFFLMYLANAKTMLSKA